MEKKRIHVSLDKEVLKLIEHKCVELGMDRSVNISSILTKYTLEIMLLDEKEDR